MKNIYVDELNAGRRIDQFLADHFNDISRNQLSKIITDGEVLINDKTTKPSQKVQVDDKITIREIKIKAGFKAPKGEKIKLDIIYEDDDVIVINKSAGMVVHPADGNKSGTLVNALINHYRKIVDAIYDEDSEISRRRPGIVHRLDKDTSGVMIIAKNKVALDFLSNEIQSRQVEKYYCAICLDNFTNRSGEIRNLLIRHPKERKQMTVSKNEKGKEAITKYKVKKSYKYINQNISLVEFQILTGRTHQIRVHSNCQNSPVLGDKVYNTKASLKLSSELNIARPLLHSHKLKITLPSGENRTFSAEMPKDFNEIMDKIS